MSELDFMNLDDFSIQLNNQSPTICNVTSCHNAIIYTVTLVYCWCDDIKGEHGHPARHDDYLSGEDNDGEIVTVGVCHPHAAKMINWESYHSMLLAEQKYKTTEPARSKK